VDGAPAAGRLEGGFDVEAAAEARLLLALGALAHQPAQALDQRRRLDALGAVGLDGLDGPRQRVQALEQHVDGVMGEPGAALAQELEDVLHLVGEGGHALEAHGGARALQRVGDAEDRVDRLAVARVGLDLDDGEVELLEVLGRLGEEQRQVLVELHHPSLR
jgi:hypothetical protein